MFKLLSNLVNPVSNFIDKFVKAELTVNVTKGTVKLGKKSSVVAMNEGFLCDSTIKELLEFKPDERPDTTAKKLANLVLEAGLKLSEAQFVKLFEAAKGLKDDNELENEDD